MAKQKSAWPRGAWHVTEDEYIAAVHASNKTTPDQDAWQVVRYCRGAPFYADSARRWLANRRTTGATNVRSS